METNCTSQHVQQFYADGSTQLYCLPLEKNKSKTIYYLSPILNARASMEINLVFGKMSVSIYYLYMLSKITDKKDKTVLYPLVYIV